MVDRKFGESNIDGAIEELETRLATMQTDHFKRLIGAEFTNEPSLILTEINNFISACQESFDVQVVYIEMNGFDINYDRWYFDLFGYAHYEDDLDDLEWLADWQSDEWPEVTLTGMEMIQRDFEWYHTEKKWKDTRYGQTYEVAVLLVMTKFVALVRSALRSGELIKPIPVLATAHEFDSIGRFAP